LQKLLITGKRPAPFSFQRKLSWSNVASVSPQLEVADSLDAESWKSVEQAGVGVAQTSIYVVMSRTYQAGQMQPWLDLTSEVKRLPEGAPLKAKRIL
jgi:hypothetical protein